MAGAVPAREHPAVLGLSLAAQPLNGSAPLVVAFRAEVTPGSLSATFSWSFGDGAVYQEMATSYSSVEHAYALAGTYLAHVDVTSSAGNGNASVPVHVLPGSLFSSISATPLEGPAPLTVHFVATPAGGTGTYASIVWHFGDGDNGSGPDLMYTFPAPGRYNVSVNVTDSSGAVANAGIGIRVDPEAPGPVSASSSPAFGIWIPPIALGLAAAAGAVVTFRSIVVRRAGPPPAGPTSTATAPSPILPAAAGPVTPEAMAETTLSQSGLEDSRRLSERILIHLYWYGRPIADGVAGPDASQAGMARRLRQPQNSLSRALARLVDAGTVKVELRHVAGAPRRLKTYSLTPRGEALARAIRSDNPPPPER